MRDAYPPTDNAYRETLPDHHRGDDSIIEAAVEDRWRAAGNA
jgi:hypothetical protein